MEDLKIKDQPCAGPTTAPTDSAVLGTRISSLFLIGDLGGG